MQKVDEDYAVSHKQPDIADTALKRTTPVSTDKAPKWYKERYNVYSALWYKD